MDALSASEADDKIAVYEGCNETGEYRIVIYTVDQENLEGRPRTEMVWVGFTEAVYLPLVLRGQ